MSRQRRGAVPGQLSLLELLEELSAPGGREGYVDNGDVDVDGSSRWRVIGAS